MDTPPAVIAPVAPTSPFPPPLAETLITASAGFGIRFLARFVDLIFSALLGLLVGVIGGVIFGVMQAMGKMPAGWMEHVQDTTPQVFLFSILGSFLYYSFSEGICGMTMGKLICGLHVVQRESGHRCTINNAFKRDFLYHWDALFIGLIGYVSMKDSKYQQRYGDKWAGTVVVKKVLYAPNPPPEWKIPVGILVGSCFALLCDLASLLLKIF